MGCLDIYGSGSFDLPEFTYGNFGPLTKTYLVIKFREVLICHFEIIEISYSHRFGLKMPLHAPKM